MVDDRQEHYEVQDEGEYHFSDDQMNYDMEAEMPKATQAAPLSGLTKESALAQLTPRRRLIIAVVVFVVVSGIVFKMLLPKQGPDLTNFSAANTNTPVTVAEMPKSATTAPTPARQPTVAANTNMPAATPSPTTTPEPANQPAMMPAPAPMMENAPPANPTAVSSSATAPNANTATMPTATPPVDTPAVATAPAAPMAAAQPGTTTPATAAPTENVVLTADQVKELLDRVTNLEQQNATLMNTLQTEFAQKISDDEAQLLATRGKVDELTKRVNRMEASVNQTNQLLKKVVKANVNVDNEPNAISMTPRSSAEPRMGYVVQAIIPGRAWLKSDAGDTVTVAEGDVLRGFGRVTKIDPYDGVVNIDTGNKVVTLSYGMNAE